MIRRLLCLFGELLFRPSAAVVEELRRGVDEVLACRCLGCGERVEDCLCP